MSGRVCNQSFVTTFGLDMAKEACRDFTASPWMWMLLRQLQAVGKQSEIGWQSLR
jgi:hypothetical protein